MATGSTKSGFFKGIASGFLATWRQILKIIIKPVFNFLSRFRSKKYVPPVMPTMRKSSASKFNRNYAQRRQDITEIKERDNDKAKNQILQVQQEIKKRREEMKKAGEREMSPDSAQQDTSLTKALEADISVLNENTPAENSKILGMLIHEDIKGEINRVNEDMDNDDGWQEFENEIKAREVDEAINGEAKRKAQKAQKELVDAKFENEMIEARKRLNLLVAPAAEGVNSPAANAWKEEIHPAVEKHKEKMAKNKAEVDAVRARLAEMDARKKAAIQSGYVEVENINKEPFVMVSKNDITAGGSFEIVDASAQNQPLMNQEEQEEYYDIITIPSNKISENENILVNELAAQPEVNINNNVSETESFAMIVEPVQDQVKLINTSIGNTNDSAVFYSLLNDASEAKQNTSGFQNVSLLNINNDNNVAAVQSLSIDMNSMILIPDNAKFSSSLSMKDLESEYIITQERKEQEQEQNEQEELQSWR